jgi:hypothetical protein
MLTAQASYVQAAEVQSIHAKVNEVVEDIITLERSVVLGESRSDCPGTCICAQAACCTKT